MKPPSEAEIKKQIASSEGPAKASAIATLGRLKAPTDPGLGLELACEARGLIDPALHLKELSLILNLEGDCHFFRGSFPEALSASSQALELQKQLDPNGPLLVRTYTQLANAHLRLNAFESALKYYQKALEYHKADKNDAGVALVLGNLSLVYKELGESTKSYELSQQALKRYRKIGNSLGEARTLANQGTILFDQGFYMKSVKAHLEALKIRESQNDREGMAHSLGCIGISYSEENQLDKAEEYLQKALAIARDLDNHYYMAHYLSDLAGIYNEIGNIENSLASSLEALEHSRLGGMHNIEIQTLMKIAKTCKIMDNPREGLAYAQMAVTKVEEYGSRRYDARTLELQADLHLELGELSEAEACVQQAFDATLEEAVLFESSDLYKLRSELRQAQGRFEEAYQDLAEHMRLREEMIQREQDVKLEQLQARYDTERANQQAEIYRLKNVNLKKKNKTILEQRKALEASTEKYRRVAEELADSDRMKELLLDIITHDLKNPASTILGLADAVRMDHPEDPLISAIYDSSDRLIKVLENTTLLTKATLGESIPTQKISIRQMLTDVLQEMDSPLKGAGMAVDLVCEGPVNVNANPILAEVFKNYISNAIKYAAEGKHLSIEARPAKQGARVCISDRGETIQAADRERIFTRQVQLGSGKKRGRGLGLAIVKRIANAHAAQVWVEPNEPRGNRFYIEFER